MKLQKFVTESFEAMGGIVEPIEYALCNVLIPDDYSDMFQGREELKLSFDFEVAQENPDSEFVTFGSYILNQIFEIISKEAVSSVRYVVVDRLNVSNAENKIKKHLNLLHGSVNIISEQPVMGYFLVYSFRIGYISDEKIEDFEDVWMDMLTLKDSERMREQNPGMFYENAPLYNYPVPVFPDIPTSFEKAYKQMKKNAEIKARHHSRRNEMEKEIARIRSYYSELKQENKKRKSRKGISEKRVKEITEKGKLLELERERQLREMQNKYRVKTDISLEHAVLYEVPHIEYRIKVSQHGSEYESILYYNPVLKDFTDNRS